MRMNDDVDVDVDVDRCGEIRRSTRHYICLHPIHSFQTTSLSKNLHHKYTTEHNTNPCFLSSLSKE
jgi:hypothetical protein